VHPPIPAAARRLVASAAPIIAERGLTLVGFAVSSIDRSGAQQLMLPFNGMTTGTQNQVTFSEVVFGLQMTPGVVLAAIIFALVMGLFGGIFPAWHASRREILSALRG